MNGTLAALAEKRPDHFMRKFCFAPREWMQAAQRIGYGLGLHRSPPLRILDLGCGFGYFMLACRQWGHAACGLDVDDPAIREGAAALGCEFTPHAIRAYQSLPEKLTGFDLITQFGVNLRTDDGADWTWAPWAFLGQDVLARLNLLGRWVIRPNLQGGQALCLDSDEWGERLPGISAEVTDHQIAITRRV